VAEEVPDFSSGPSDATDPRRKVLLYRNKENDNVDAASRVGVFQTLTEGDDLVVGAEKMERPGAEHRFEEYQPNHPQKQRDKSTTTIAIKKRTAAIDSRRRIDPEASVPAPARPQEEGAHRNPHNGVGSRKGLAENATHATRRPTSERRRLRGSPHRSDDRIQSEREK